MAVAARRDAKPDKHRNVGIGLNPVQLLDDGLRELCRAATGSRRGCTLVTAVERFPTSFINSINVLG